MPTPAPAPIAGAPPVPNSALEEPTFDAQFEAFLNWLNTEAQPGMNAAAANVAANANDAFISADNAATAALSSSAAADVSLAASNFKGEYAGMAGALNRPASVRHLGSYWLLLQNLANVTTAVPGTHAAWAPLQTGIQLTQVITANTTAVPGIRYIIAAAGITLTAPTSPAKGTLLSVREAIPAGSTYNLNFGSSRVRGATWGNTLIRSRVSGLDMIYEDATRGFI